MRKKIAFAIVCLLVLPRLIHCEEATPKKDRIAFGSCNKQHRSQKHWQTIAAEKPDLFLFIGDTIYADTDDMRVKKEAFKTLFSSSDFLTLWKTTRVEAIWDDHDFARDDTSGADYKMRAASQKTFLDAFQVPENSPRRKHPGIYTSWIQGPPNQQIQIILLDTRYFKSSLLIQKPTEAEIEKGIIGKHPPLFDRKATLLGKTQWAWLEKELLKPAQIRIIASGIQVIPDERHRECWGNFPHERQRLFNLIKKTNASGIFFISGDAHFSEISKTNEGAYPLYDFTSSSLNQTNIKRFNSLNTKRIPGMAYAGTNYGLIEIDWEKKDPEIHLITKSVEGKMAFEQVVLLSELQFSKKNETETKQFSPQAS